MLRLIPDLENYSYSPFAAVGLVLLVVIFLIIAFFVHGKKKPRSAKIVVLRKVKCPDCVGGKVPDWVHDSADIQFVSCGRCGGTGTILVI